MDGELHVFQLRRFFPSHAFMKWGNALFSAESRIVSTAYKVACLRPSSAPFLSIDNFLPARTKRYVTGETQDFRPESIKSGETVFCGSYLLRDFFTGPAQSIKCPFVLLSGNGDVNVDSSYHAMLPATVIRWFAQNVIEYHERISPLPIGLENRALHSNGIISVYQALRRRNPDKKNRLLHAFTVETNPIERGAVKQIMDTFYLADAIPRANSREYLGTLATYRFVVSPPGGGTDCHRTWEAMYLRVVPIVRRCYLTEFYRNLGLPMILVNTWTELLAWDEDYLDQQYRDLAPFFENPVLWHEYWENRILREAR